MKFRSLFTIALICLIVSCQNEKPSDIRVEVNKWVQMWNTYDLDQVDELFVLDEQLSYFSSETEGCIYGIDAVREHHKGFGFIPGGREQENRLWLEDMEVSDTGNNPVVTAIWYFQKTSGEIQRGPVSIVYRKIDGKQRIYHMNFANYPFPVLSKIVEGAQAQSLFGEPRFSTGPPESVVQKYETAKELYLADTSLLDNLIWLGRWTAYMGDYREAIRIYSKGLKQFPGESRLFRHRGHRYISIREFDKAAYDFEMAALLINNQENSIEPDGMPNARNLPVSTRHGNIWYHLGLAYYLLGEYKKSLDAYQRGLESSTNDDNVVSVTHWIFMNNMLLGNEDDAYEALKRIKPEMDVIENMSYHRLCLFYKGELTEEELLGDKMESSAGDAVLFGIGNWHLYHQDTAKAKSYFDRIMEGPGWASFGYIAAEVALHEK